MVPTSRERNGVLLPTKDEAGSCWPTTAFSMGLRMTAGRIGALNIVGVGVIYNA
jgi:hypothetical protein